MRAALPLNRPDWMKMPNWLNIDVQPWSLLAVLTVLYMAPGVTLRGEETPPSYSRDIQPIFARNCQGCHQAAKAQGDYLMTDFGKMVAGGESGQAAIVPGDPDNSYLVSLIVPSEGVAEMPKQGKPLSPVEIDLIRRWIAAGAHDDSPADAGAKYSADNPPVYRRPPAITSLHASPQGDLLAVAGFHEVLLVQASDGALVARLVGLSERIESVRFSPDGGRLAVAGGQPGKFGELQVWDVAQKSLLLSATYTFETLRGVSWSPDGQMIAFGCADKTLRAVDATTGQQRLFQGAHEDWVLGTAFTHKGDHLVSVAQDMTCKLTETATERFIDNITSITPGALRGGLSSVVTIPGRDEILVGGADGVAKVYRIFREAARQIGDDANLIRELPALPGRIFAVDFSHDGSRLAAVASLDGRSEVRIWRARAQAEMPADIKAIQLKQAGQRSPEEKEKLAAFVTPADEQLAQLVIPEAAAYAVSFLSNNELAVGCADGSVRIIDTAGQVARTFSPAPVSKDADGLKLAYEPTAWRGESEARVAEEVQAAPHPELAWASDKIVGLSVLPNGVASLRSPYDYLQLLVTATTASGEQFDVTRIARYTTTDAVYVTADGLLRPVRSGDAKVEISVGGHTAQLQIENQWTGLHADSAAVAHRQIDFIRDVNPVLSRMGCNQGTCHGAQKGKNGFKLSLRGYDPLFDIRALTDDLASRRINLASPDDSLMLLKALGRVPHEGGALVAAGSPQHGILREWIAQGAKLDLTSPKAIKIEIAPENPIALDAQWQQQVRVVAHYPDGTTRDVTHEAFVESGNTEVATASRTGLLTSVRRGEAPILARYEGNYAATTLTVMGKRDDFQWEDVPTYGAIDEFVAAKWQRMKIRPSDVCDDATYLRRVYLDLTGLPPTAAEVRQFIADTRDSREKRAAVVDQLLGSPAFVDYWTNKWADLLLVNRKFLGTEGAAEFRQWIEKAVRENKPYDQFAKEILTSTGSNKANPAASYYKILRTPEDTMENTTHLFLGVRFNCNKCHDHPFERWTQDQYYQTAAFFAKTKLRKAPEAGDAVIGGSAVEGAKPLYEEVYDDAHGDILHPRNNEPVVAEFPYDCEFTANEDATPRDRLAAWMTAADNPYFARSYVNRIWGYMLGVGLIEPIDDIRAGNPPSNPELLDYLTKEFVASGFDARHVMRMICTSRTYQLSVETNPWNADDRLNYSHALPRRLPAEVLYDTIHAVTGSKTKIPGVPEGTRAAALPDAGVATPDGFLANLGRPVRESACECERSSELQLGPIMALVSGPTVGSAIADSANDLGSLVGAIPDDRALVEELFLRILNRMPTDAEVAAYQEMLGEIEQDHQILSKRLEEREAWWVEELPRLQAEQTAAVAAAKEQLAQLEASLAPERTRLEQERLDRIAAAEAEVKKAEADVQQRITQWESEQAAAQEWWPLRPGMMQASAGTVLRAQEDRSIVAEGAKEKGVYEVTFDSQLDSVTGLRLEALPVAGLPGGGPGFPPNGNFVVTEFEVLAAPLSDPGQQNPVKLVAGKASFTQAGFAIEQAFDGNKDNQQGWAVHPAGGVTQWATFQLAEPLRHEGGTRWTIKIHQHHDAAEHRLARFRISATKATGAIQLGLPEAFAAVLATAAEKRSEADAKPLLDYLVKTDPTIQAARDRVGVASVPVPENEQVVALKRSIAELEKPIPVDAPLLSLRSDKEQSEAQMKNLRLTAAEDLTWALVNSPAFLFNR